MDFACGVSCSLGHPKIDSGRSNGEMGSLVLNWFTAQEFAPLLTSCGRHPSFRSHGLIVTTLRKIVVSD